MCIDRKTVLYVGDLEGSTYELIQKDTVVNGVRFEFEESGDRYVDTLIGCTVQPGRWLRT
jgi:hypothetical protein